MGERPVFDQSLEVRPVHAVLDGAGQARANLGLVAVADRFDEEVAQRPAVELEVAEHVEDLAAQRPVPSSR